MSSSRSAVANRTGAPAELNVGRVIIFLSHIQIHKEKDSLYLLMLMTAVLSVKATVPISQRSKAVVLVIFHCYTSNKGFELIHGPISCNYGSL